MNLTTLIAVLIVAGSIFPWIVLAIVGATTQRRDTKLYRQYLADRAKRHKPLSLIRNRRRN